MGAEQPVKMDEERDRRDWESWVDQQIREAQDRGVFDQLPGKGRPLDLTPNPYAQEQEMAFKILRDAGYAPEWIELDKVIRGKLERSLAMLARRWEWRELRLGELAVCSSEQSELERLRVEAGWQRAVAAFEAEVEGINREIAELNLKVPGPRFQRSMVNPDREVGRLMGGSHERRA
jgi:DnaJ family protein C protein 28